MYGNSEIPRWNFPVNVEFYYNVTCSPKPSTFADWTWPQSISSVNISFCSKVNWSGVLYMWLSVGMLATCRDEGADISVAFFTTQSGEKMDSLSARGPSRIPVKHGIPTRSSRPITVGRLRRPTLPQLVRARVKLRRPSILIWWELETSKLHSVKSEYHTVSVWYYCPNNRWLRPRDFIVTLPVGWSEQTYLLSMKLCMYVARLALDVATCCPSQK